MKRRFAVAAALPVLLLSSLLTICPGDRQQCASASAGVESTVDLAGKWQVQNSTATPDTGDLISRRGYSPTGWLPVQHQRRPRGRQRGRGTAAEHPTG